MGNTEAPACPLHILALHTPVKVFDKGGQLRAVTFWIKTCNQKKYPKSDLEIPEKFSGDWVFLIFRILFYFCEYFIEL